MIEISREVIRSMIHTVATAFDRCVISSTDSSTVGMPLGSDTRSRVGGSCIRNRGRWSLPRPSSELMSNIVDTAVAATSLVPTAATIGKRGHWSPVEIFQSAVTIRGGFCKAPTIATTVDYRIGNTTHRFVEMDKNAAWFLKGVGGPKTRKGELKAVQVLHCLLYTSPSPRD